MAFQIFLIGKNNISYEIITFNSISINKNTPVSPMPMPEEDSEENMLMKIEGNSTQISVNWTLINGQSPCGTGAITKGATKWEAAGNLGELSVKKQMDQLDELSPKSLTDFYSLRIYDTEAAANAEPTAYDGMMQSLQFTTSSASPVNWNVSLNYIQGNVITSMSGNTAEEPIVESAYYLYDSGGLRTGIKVNFKEFASYASGDRPVTTGAILRYKQDAGLVDFWREKQINFTQNTNAPYDYVDKPFFVNDLVVEAGSSTLKNYKIRLALLTDAGRGDWSDGELQVLPVV